MNTHFHAAEEAFATQTWNDEGVFRCQDGSSGGGSIHFSSQSGAEISLSFEENPFLVESPLSRGSVTGKTSSSKFIYAKNPLYMHSRHSHHVGVSSVQAKAYEIIVSSFEIHSEPTVVSVTVIIPGLTGFYLPASTTIDFPNSDFHLHRNIAEQPIVYTANDTTTIEIGNNFSLPFKVGANGVAKISECPAITILLKGEKSLQSLVQMVDDFLQLSRLLSAEPIDCSRLLFSGCVDGDDKQFELYREAKPFDRVVRFASPTTFQAVVSRNPKIVEQWFSLISEIRDSMTLFESALFSENSIEAAFLHRAKACELISKVLHKNSNANMKEKIEKLIRGIPEYPRLEWGSTSDIAEKIKNYRNSLSHGHLYGVSDKYLGPILRDPGDIQAILNCSRVLDIAIVSTVLEMLGVDDELRSHVCGCHPSWVRTTEPIGLFRSQLSRGSAE